MGEKIGKVFLDDTLYPGQDLYSDGAIEDELLEIARICRRVPAKPARSFREGIQGCWLMSIAAMIECCGAGVSLGRCDQYLYPLYKAGLEDGTLTEERAMEILECMFIKVGEVVPYQGKSTAGGHEGYTHFEALSLGGLTPDGRDVTNPLTYLILRSKKEFPSSIPMSACWFTPIPRISCSGPPPRW